MIKKKKFIFITLLFFFVFFLQSNNFSALSFEIEANKIVYQNDNQTIIAYGNAIAKDSNSRIIKSDKIIFYKNKNIINTEKNSEFTDSKIKINADNFIYDIKKKKITAEINVQLIDEANNKFLLDRLNYNEIERIGEAINVKAYLNDGSFLSSKSGKINNNNGKFDLIDTIYTTCKDLSEKNETICPSWSLKTKETQHNKNKKKIIHRHPVLRLKNIPVFYLPYVSHPDPSVERQSGFLPPIIKTFSDMGRTVKTPYFWAISNDKDLTISPTYYFDEEPMFQASYRQSIKNGYFQIETGFTEGYKNLNKSNRTSGSRNYFFSNYDKSIKNFFLGDNELNIKVQRVSQENFLRVNKINTKFFNEDIRSLENSFKITSYGENKKFDFKTGIFENLDIADSSKYTYYLPEGSYSQNKKILGFNTNFNSYFQGRKFLKNQKQGKIRNTFSANSKQITNKSFGLISEFKSTIYNNNIYNDNVTGLKENENIDNYFTLATDLSLPFAKFSKNNYQILKPRIFVKHTTGNMIDASSSEKILNYSDIFSMNRTNSLDNPETGSSLGYGLNYDLNLKNITNQEIKTSLGIGQVMRNNKQNKMPIQSSLNNKTSDYAGFLKFNILEKNELKNNSRENFSSKNNMFNGNQFFLKYDYNLDNNLAQFNRNKFELNGTYQGLNSKIEFDEKTNHIGNERYGKISINKTLKDNYFLSVEGKKDLKNDRSEYNRISINFENDCLVTSLTLSKDFYQDKDIKNSKTLIFGILIKPFSDSFGPDLSDFIN
jgi:LPS-assembly protein